MTTKETQRVRVYFRNLDGDEVSTVHSVTLTTDHELIEFVDEAIERTHERDDFRDMEDCDCASVI
jgi:DNA-binding protein Fis